MGPKKKTVEAFGRKKKGCKRRGPGRPKKMESELASSGTSASGSVRVVVNVDSDGNVVTPSTSTVPDNASDATPKLSASKRKLTMSSTSPLKGQSDNGYRIIHFDRLKALIEKLRCPSCPDGKVQLVEGRRFGMDSSFEVHCSSCVEVVSKSTTSNVVGTARAVNLSLVASARNCGLGLGLLEKFFMGMNMPQPLVRSSFNEIQKILWTSSQKVLEECFAAAATIVRERYLAENNELNEDSVLDIDVSYDGTWHKRGHSSKYGVGIVIELESGLILDAAVLSNFCRGCVKAPSKDSPQFTAWKEKHVCEINHTGSANSMECAAAVKIFKRSEEKHKLRYPKVLCDGDAKTIAALNKEKVYSIEVVKEDCVNHVAKRMYKGIQTLRRKLAGTKEKISGRGKGQVTELVQTRLSAYYAQQLKLNAPDVNKMKTGVMASLRHMASTDENPQHDLCPKGESSWCFHNRALALKEEPWPHKTSLNQNAVKQLEPLYDRLTNAELLGRCSRMMTQNPNESFNATMWLQAPKTQPASKAVVEIALAMATVEFNYGPRGFRRILRGLGVEGGINQNAAIVKAVKRRVSCADKAASPGQIQKRKRRKLDKAAKRQDSCQGGPDL